MEGLKKNCGPKVNLDKLKEIDPNVRRMADGSPLIRKCQTKCHTVILSSPEVTQLATSRDSRTHYNFTALSRPSEKDIEQISEITLRSSISSSQPHDDLSACTTRVPRCKQKGSDANDGGAHVKRSGKRRTRPLFIGEAVIRDLSAGLDDTLEKLMRAAVLRSFVPSTMSSSTSPAEAFARYCNAAPSLAKVKHEQEAFLIAKEYALELKSEGFSCIRQLLPFIESEDFFTRFGMSKTLISSICSVMQVLQGVTMLKKYGRVEVLNKYKLLNDARSFLARSTSGLEPSESRLCDKVTHAEIEEKSNISIRGQSQQKCALGEVEKEGPRKTYDVAVHQNFQETEGARLCHTNTLAALYQDENNWGTLQDPVDNLLAVAAFFIFPSLSTELGPSVFAAFLGKVSALHGQEDLQHAAIKTR